MGRQARTNTDGTDDGPVFLRGLTGSQRRAVMHGLEEPESPLIVLAGPGTGKTKVITHRIARLLEAGSHRGRVDPERVLAVTFTVNAAAQMQERLTGLVGVAPAARVNVQTLHGFGMSLLRRFGDVLGIDARRVQFIDSAQTLRLMMEIMQRGRLFEDRLAEGRRSLVPELTAFVSACRNRGLTAAHVIEHAERSVAGAQRNERGLAGEELAAERARARELHERARVYERFERACLERHWMTFDDCLSLPVALMDRREDIAAIIRDDYRHIVVDEFQDVNAAQIELLRRVSPPSGSGAAPHRDLCVVGDDDQAIYGFRGATDRAFARFQHLWSGAETIPLTGNFRSGRKVLDVANAVISRSKSRFDPDKRVEVASDSPQRDVPGVTEGVILESDDDAGAVIASAIRAQRAERPGLRWDDHAVIVRTNTEQDRLAADLQVEGIPVRVVRQREALDDRTVQDLLAWIELVAEPSSRAAAQRLLARPPLAVEPAMLASWMKQHRARMAASEGADEDGLEPDSPREPIVPWLERHAGEHPAVRRLAAVWREAGEVSLRDGAAAATLTIINRAGLAHPLVEADGSEGAGDEHAWRSHTRTVARLARVLAFVQSRRNRLEPPGGLAEFWSYFTDLSDADRALMGLDEGSRLEPANGAAPEEDGDDAVAILTAHRAKGLEFDTVFVSKVRPRGFPGAKREREGPALPDDLRLPWDEQEHAGGGEGGAGDDARWEEDEERRLFYVACTRAERRLVLLAKHKKAPGAVTDYFNELTLEAPPDRPLLTVRQGAEVLAESPGQSGRSDAAGDALRAASARVDAGTDAERAMRSVGESQVRSVRRRLAEAIERAGREDLEASDVESLSREVADLVSRLPVASHLARRGRLPGWAGRGGPGSDYATDLAARAAAVSGAGGASSRGSAGRLFAPVIGPQVVTYSKIDLYERCPCCYYLKHHLGLADDRGEPALVGEAVHAALEVFYSRLRGAESGDGPETPPTLDDLLGIGRREFTSRWPADRPIDRDQAAQVEAQLRLLHSNLHDDSAEVLELEKDVPFPFEHKGVTHTVRAKIDRVDRVGGAHVIIDYKTGQSWKTLLQPKPDDLQLGLYAMALGALFPGVDIGACRAEYWLLATGERGRIALADLNMDKVRARIGKFLDGLAAGEFTRKEKGSGPLHEGPCEVFSRAIGPAPASTPAESSEAAGGSRKGATRRGKE